MIGNSHLVSVVKNFVKRDLRVRYTESFLGPIWIILQPLLLSLVIIGIFSWAFKSKIDYPPYYIYVLFGFLNWEFFSQSISQSCSALTNQRSLLVNTNIPVESLVISKQISRLIDLLAGLGVLSLFLLISGVKFHWGMLVYLLIIGLQLAFQLGLSLLVAAGNVYYRDVSYLVSVILRLWFYLTPVIYPLAVIPEKMRVYLRLNPLTLFLETSRSILFDQKLDYIYMAWLVVISGVSLAVGLLVFKRLKNRFADVV